MGLKNEEARARRRQKQKDLLSCISIKSEEEVRRSYRPKLSLDNNFGWQVLEKTQVGDGYFPHLTGFYEKPDLSGKEFQKVTYVLYMDKGSVVKKDCIVEDAEPVSRVESVWTQPSSVRVVEEPSEIIERPVYVPAEVMRHEPKPKQQRKLIRDFYYRGLKSRSPSKSRSQSPVSVASEGKRTRDKLSWAKMDLTRDQSDKPKRDQSDRRKYDNKNRKMITDFQKHKRSVQEPTAKSMESIHSQPSQLQKMVSFERDLGNTARYEDEQKKLQRQMDTENERAMKEIKNKKDRGMKDMDFKKDKVEKEVPDKGKKALDKAREKMEKRQEMFKGWNLRAGASSETVESVPSQEKRTYSLGRKRDISTIRSKQSGLIESVRALPDKLKKPSENLLKTPSGSNQYLYVPVVRKNRSLHKRMVE